MKQWSMTIMTSVSCESISEDADETNSWEEISQKSEDSDDQQDFVSFDSG